VQPISNLLENFGIKLVRVVETGRIDNNDTLARCHGGDMDSILDVGGAIECRAGVTDFHTIISQKVIDELEDLVVNLVLPIKRQKYLASPRPRYACDAELIVSKDRKPAYFETYSTTMSDLLKTSSGTFICVISR